METPDEAKKGRPACEPQVRALLRRVLGQEEGREKETEEQPEEEAEIGAGEEPGFREDLQGADLGKEGGEWKERIATRRIPIGGKPC